MPKNKVSDLITDQEIAFARLVLSGTMTDRGAAQAVGLNPDTAACTKSKPRVRAYMVEHRAAVQQQLVEQETDLSRRAVEGLRRLNLGREQVLARLGEIANLGPEMTRGSISGQVKALSMIVAMQSLIPDRRAGSSENKSAPPPTHPDIYAAAWLGGQQGKTIDPQPGPAFAEEEDEPGLAEPTPGSAGDAPSRRGITPALPSTPASPPSPTALAPRKQRHRRLMPPCSFLLQTPEAPSLEKGTPLPDTAELLKENGHPCTHCQRPKRTKKDRILSNFTKTDGDEDL